MKNTDGKDLQSDSTKSKICIAVAVVLLFAMALLSSVSSAFLYIFGGLSVFFFFLAWHYSRLSIQHESSRRDTGYQNRASFVETIRSVFRTPGGVQHPLSASARKVVLLISSFIGGIFFLTILVVVFTGGGEESSNSSDSNLDADNLLSSGDYDAAYAEYRKSIVQDPSNGAAYYGIGNIKSTQNERDSALYFYGKALEADPKLYDAAYARALIYFNEENYAQSNEELKYILNRTDEYVNALLLAGDNHYLANDYDVALRYYQRAYGLGARSKELSNIMAYIYDSKGDQVKAIEHYKETLQYDSTVADVYKRLGELLPGEEGKAFRKKAEQK